MGAIGGEELKKLDLIQQQQQQQQGGMANRQEKILVLVRLRPLNDKEIAKSEVADWECINANTILYRNSLQERSGLPTAYTFDRVFSGDCTNKEVYEEGTKEIALSVVSGINSSVFAYGQTSSGKTYTMTGITEHTVADIYDYIQRHEERAFALKFSAMEIYNENVRDLLGADNTPLRLMDDPERGTIVEKLTEETLKDWNHLKKLLSICEAQRKVGETSLNEASSRSHQILRLTIESSAREFIGKQNSSTLSASVFFIDLAGSERASQSMSAGTRLKEGCHINRSLLTLGNVIRKLSKGRQGHINYRDSKLTRILQPCLGGNARTTIICTLSPARSHVEQSRNTLLFASCAKEVTTNAQVNVVMSDKALVKHLQKELARLESELRTPAPTSSSCNCAASLRKKDLQLEKMEKEIRELTKQRDIAQSRVKDLLQLVRNDQASEKQERRRRRHHWDADDKIEDECSVSELSETNCHHDGGGGCFSSRMEENEEIESVMEEDHEDQCKVVRCIEMEESSDDRRMQPLTSPTSEQVLMNGQTSDLDSLNSGTHQDGFSYSTLGERMQDVRRKIETLASPFPDNSVPWDAAADTPDSRSLNFTRSRSCRANLTTSLSSALSGKEEYHERTPPDEIERDFPGRPVSVRRRFPPLGYGVNSGKLSRNGSHSSVGTDFIDDVKSQSGKNVTDEDITSVHTFVAGLKDAKLQYEKQIGDDQDWENGAASDELRKTLRDVGLDPMLDADPSSWPQKFDSLQRAIIELWQRCNVSIVHRTYFFLLFKGDPTDSIYMAVEVRRLTFLKDTFSQGSKTVEVGQTKTLASSVKELQRERETLGKLINKRFSEEERKKLYEKWGIGLNSKRRRLQLVSRLWTDTEDMDHVKESASVVAKLVMFSQQGKALKEMFGLSFAPLMRRRSYGWKNRRTSLI